MRDYSDYVPEEYYSDLLPTGNEHDFLYLGQDNLRYWSKCWLGLANEYGERGARSTDVLTRLDLIDQSQRFRKKAKVLEELAVRADSKPLFYFEEPYSIGQHITCYVNGTLKKSSSKPGNHGRFVNTVVSGVDGKSPSYVYLLSIRNRKGDTSQRRFWFRPDKVSVIPTDDFPYLRVHPNYFKLYLNIRATNKSERNKIAQILSSL